MVSLIVATLDRVEEPERLLVSLENQLCKDFEVIVVDQNTDDRLQPVLQRHVSLSIRHLRSARGLSRARNVGLPFAQGDIIAFPDDDCWYPPQLLAEVAPWFDANPQFGALFTALRDANNRPVGPRRPESPCPASRKNMFAIGISPGAFLRRTVTDAIGPFNENIGIGASTPFQSGEDLDYFLRPLQLGFQMKFEPSLTVHHPSFHASERLERTTYGYALGGAYVLRTHGYPSRYLFSFVIRSLGGAVVSFLKADFQNSRIYLLRAAGQLRGYFWGPRDMARLEHRGQLTLMDISPRQLARNVFRFGSGEFLARVLSVAVVILLGHLYGVVVLGVYGLATTVSIYLMPVIDFGLKHVGARLIARFPSSAPEIIRRVQRRRYLMASAALPFVLLYAAVARLPFELKIFLLAFSAIGTLYAFSLDWAAWGSENLFLAGSVKAIIPACLLAGLLVALHFGHLLSWLVVGNFVGYVLQSAAFYLWWQRHRRRVAGSHDAVADIADALAWRRTSIMGLAWMSNLAFNTIDMLMLGVLSNPEQVGLYSSAYRILNQVLLAYYMLTGALYPQLARQDLTQRRRMLRPRIFLALIAVGCVLAVLLASFRRPLLAIVFGHPFVAAAPLLLVLAFAIPLDFLTSYLGNAYLAWSMERSVLICAVVAAGSNIILNLATIPRYGAIAAAINTLISYFIYLGMLAWAGRRIAQAS